MTLLKSQAKPVRRETLSMARDRGTFRPLVVELGTTFMTVRAKGMRRGFTVTYSQLYTMGARNSAEALRKERAEAKKARRKGKL